VAGKRKVKGRSTMSANACPESLNSVMKQRIKQKENKYPDIGINDERF
jgi:hypothetical protein